MQIANHQLGGDRPPFIIAEAGVNHDGDVDRAHLLIEAAARAGAHAVKFQTFSAAALVIPTAPKADYQLQTTDSGQSQAEMLAALELPQSCLEGLVGHARELGLVFLSTPFDPDSARLLARLGLDALKLGSGELTDLPLLEVVGGLGLPVLVSTGMSYLGEVERAVDCLRGAGAPSLGLLHCVSNYPAAPEDANLRAMHTLRSAFQVPVGFSDHTPGWDIAVAATALGAEVLEKHLTLSRDLPGPDHASSLDPEQFQQMVGAVLATHRALGDGRKQPRPSEANTREIARKSLVTVRPVAAGQPLKAADLGVRRPGTGLPPGELSRVLGRRAARDLEAWTVLHWDDLAY